MPSGNFGNSTPENRSRERHGNERDLDTSDNRLNAELQRLQVIADRMERDRRRGALNQQAMNRIAKATFGAMLFMLIVMLTLQGFLRILQSFYNAFF